MRGKGGTTFSWIAGARGGIVDNMASAAWLATELDSRMLNKGIAPVGTPVDSLPVRPGSEVAAELGGRLLLRYVPFQLVHEQYRDTMTFVCPTPYASEDLGSYLAMPNPTLLREFVIVLDPAKLDRIAGPRWCDLGQGIEYILTSGYTPDTIIAPGWAVRIR
jgi:hypothetical protein